MKRTIEALAAASIAVGLIGFLPQKAMADDRIFTVVTGDWNQDGTADAAMLRLPDDDAPDHTLVLYLADRVTRRLRLTATADNFVWGWPDTAGQSPRLEAMANGSLAVHSQNEAIGRNRWAQKLTVAYRNGTFVVAGFTYAAYDTLSQNPDEDALECDLNILTGEGLLDGEPLRFSTTWIPLDAWTQEFGLKVCRVI
ncbi:MAG: hypothetical protein AAGL24_12520 [Pseudomonadota bacterium]